jgi:hypothetical protein
MVENMDWISVKDRLPVIPEGLYGVKVIIAEYDPCCNEYSVHECMFGKYPKSVLWPASKKNDFMTLYVGKHTCWGPIPDIVTHWMPMPEPPEYVIENGE